MIKRYESYSYESLHWPPQPQCDMREADDGEWVPHADHAARVAELEARLAAGEAGLQSSGEWTRMQERIAELEAERDDLRDTLNLFNAEARAGADDYERLEKDAQRYRWIRRSESRLDTPDEESLSAVWKQLILKGCDEERMDAIIDAGMRGAGEGTGT